MSKKLLPHTYTLFVTLSTKSAAEYISAFAEVFENLEPVCLQEDTLANTLLTLEVLKCPEEKVPEHIFCWSVQQKAPGPSSDRPGYAFVNKEQHEELQKLLSITKKACKD